MNHAAYPLRDEIDFQTPHDAAVFVEQLVTRGEIKRCGHLSVEWLRAGNFGPRYYRPVCAADCFIQSREGDYAAAGYVTIFRGCPPDCRRSVSMRRRRLRDWRRQTLWGVRAAVVGIAGYFKSLPTTVQVLLLAVLLALIGIPFRGLMQDVLEIVKAVVGK